MEGNTHHIVFVYSWQTNKPTLMHELTRVTATFIQLFLNGTKIPVRK